MSRERTEYEGKEVVYEEDEEKPELVVEGREVEVIHEGEGYYTKDLPYTTYPSLRELAEALVDHWQEVEPALGRTGRDDE